VHVVGQRVSFFDPTLLLLGQLAEHSPKRRRNFPYGTFSAALEDEHNMVVFALPLAMA
jgi:hypothetical protein